MLTQARPSRADGLMPVHFAANGAAGDHFNSPRQTPSIVIVPTIIASRACLGDRGRGAAA